ncbi:hypothetical protein [Microvirga makkahensis]|uniref:Uncharacterized protein n=1 Tax=Microvirga makkahensis TaxID=1128670 RepID=A0A7X3MRI8_9HYPH|nr:hypothetical protein [Microvirga makkahensis]MXQ11921.1 hypothetical protein [Microvirga makkahensis]
MRASFKVLMAATLFLGGAAALEPSPASAQPRWERPIAPRSAIRVPAYRDRAFAGPRIYRGARYYGPGPRVYRGARYYGYRDRGYRRAYYGRRYYGGYPYRYYRRGYGGAVVAGLLGGLALGAIANPYYYGYGPAYYPSYQPAYFGSYCVIERRRVVNRYGRLVLRRVEVCY